MNINGLKKGDFVYYNDFIEDTFAKSDKQLGVIVHVYEHVNPLFDYMRGGDLYAHEYVVIWISTGFRSTLLGMNLTKVVLPSDTLSKNQ